MRTLPPLVPVALGRDEERHLPWLLEKGARLFLDDAVGLRHPRAQVLELEQRMKEKRLDDPAAGPRILENAPSIGAVALPRFRRVATDDEVLRLMAKPIAESERARRPGAIATD